MLSLYNAGELRDNFHTIKENWHRLMNRQRWLDYWQNIYSRSLSVLPYFLLLPQFISGQINLGGLMKSRGAFMLVSNNLSWFIYKYDELAELAAVIDRLYEFHQLTEQRPTNKPKIANMRYKWLMRVFVRLIIRSY